MKTSYKITLISVAALMAITPLMAVPQTSQGQTVLAARRRSTGSTIQIRSGNYGIQLYTRTGARYNGKRTVKAGSTIRVYGQPVLIRGPKIPNDTAFPPERIINGQRYYWLGDNGYIKTHNVGSSDNKGNLRVMFNSYIYNKNGKRLRSYRGRSALITKNSTIKYLGKTYAYNPSAYYNIGGGVYVKASDVARANGKGIMQLNYNSYIYNKRGKRIRGQRKLLKGQVVNYTGKITSADAKSSDYYFYRDNNRDAYQLSSTKIKGQRYYAIGSGRYINAANVSVIGGNYVYTNLPTYVVPSSDMFVLNQDLHQTSQVVRRGQKVKVDGAITNGEGDNAELYYRLAGSKAKYLWWGDASEYPENAFNEGNYTIRFNMNPSTDLNEITRAYITFKNSRFPNYNTPLYTINGTKRDLGGSFLAIPPEGNSIPDQYYDIDSAWYIYNKADKQTELYYHLKNVAFDVQNPHPATGQRENTRQIIGDSFVKASDVDIHGLNIKTLNTQAEAQTQAGQTATASQKEQLNSYISNAASVRNTDKYKLTTGNNRDNYDTAIKDAQAAVNSNTTTVFEVNFLNWLLNKDQNALDGAKVQVKNINNLTATEAAEVQRVMNNANSNLPGFVSVSIYQHWAHKSGYYPKYVWTSSQKSVFMLCRDGYKNQILNVKDYATQK